MPRRYAEYHTLRTVERNSEDVPFMYIIRRLLAFQRFSTVSLQVRILDESSFRVHSRNEAFLEQKACRARMMAFLLSVSSHARVDIKAILYD